MRSVKVQRCGSAARKQGRRQSSQLCPAHRGRACFKREPRHLLDQFRRAGAEDGVESWIGDGFNLPLADAQVRAAIDPETLKEFAHQLGLSEDELVERLASELPEAVHRVVASTAAKGTSALQSY